MGLAIASYCRKAIFSRNLFLLMLLGVFMAWISASVIRLQLLSVPQLLNNDSDHSTSTFYNLSDHRNHLPNGYHYTLDLYDIESQYFTLLESPEGLKIIAEEITRSGMTLLGSRVHHFPEGGLSAVFLISESHVSIHTWPEYFFIALDVYTCGEPSAAKYLVSRVYAVLKPGRAKVLYIARGSEPSEPNQVQVISDIQQVFEVNNGSGRKLYNYSQSDQQPAGNPILLDTIRPASLHNLPATVDICANADFARGECILWRNASLLYSQQSEAQLVEVVDRQFGVRCLLLDGLTQFCNSSDNDLYTRSLTEYVMQPLLARRSNIDVVVVGGGDGWVATHLITAYSDHTLSILVVDLDPVVSIVTQQFFPITDGHDSFKDVRVRYLAENAAVWVSSAAPSSVDVIIIDCTDHKTNSGSVLYTEPFYSDILRILRPGGMFSQPMNTVHQRYLPFREQVEGVWSKLGFIDVMVREVETVSYGNDTITMVAQKPI